MKYLYTILTLVFLFSCTKESEITYKGTKSAQKYSITLDSLAIPISSNISDKLELIDFNDKTILIDLMLSEVYEIDLDSKSLKKVIKKGNGPNELPMNGIEFIAIRDNSLVLIGSSYNYHTFSANYERMSSSFIDWKYKSSPRELNINPDPENPIQYTMSYGFTRYLHSIDNLVLLPKFTPPPIISKFNAKGEEFYKGAKMFAAIDFNVGLFSRMLGNYPKVFPVQLRDYIYFNYTKLNDEILVSYMPDSLIYVFDKKLDFKYTFGNRAENISDNYTEIDAKNINFYQSEFRANNEKYGFYNQLSAFDETGLVSRLYKSGGKVNTTYIQLYLNYSLIGELKESENLKVYKDGKYFLTPQLNKVSKQLLFKYLSIIGEES